MERRKWETAIRCLEVAVHPHTSDGEVIAAVNGFRRTADGVSLAEICRAIAGGEDEARDAMLAVARLQGEKATLEHDNRALQHQLEVAESRHHLTRQRLRETERRLAEIAAQLRQAQRATEPTAPQRPASRFQKVLEEARQRANAPDPLKDWTA